MALPNIVSVMVGKAFFAGTGWTYDRNPELWSDKQVVIGFPHTSNMDAVRAFALFMALGLKTYTLIKRELFVWPLSMILRLVGGLPVDRANSGQIVTKMADEFRQRKARAARMAASRRFARVFGISPKRPTCRLY